MGAQPGTYARDLATVRDIPSIPAIPGDQHPIDVLRRRPDTIAAERRLAASKEQIGAAISDYYPKISLSGALGPRHPPTAPTRAPRHRATARSSVQLSRGAGWTRRRPVGKTYIQNE
jgi:outer membrane protein TolC